MEKKRVVVTGMGIVSPIGNSVDTFWDNVKNQKVGIKEIDRFDASEYKAKLAAQVEDFNPADYMDPKAARRMELFSQYAVAATKQALDDSGLDLETSYWCMCRFRYRKFASYGKWTQQTNRKRTKENATNACTSYDF